MLTAKRALLFLIGCIGSRSLLAYIAATISSAHLPYLAVLTMIPVLGWIYIMWTGSRKTGLETDGEPIWWNHMRPLHAVNYAAFSLFALAGNEKAFLFLVYDVIIGLFAWFRHHFLQ
jgi:hypothetical protein